MGRFFLSVSDAKIILHGHFFFLGENALCAAVPYARTSSRRKSSHARRNIVPSQKMQLKANSP